MSTDPNGTLKEVRRLAKDITAPYNGPGGIERITSVANQGRFLARYFLELDKWLLEGGYLPIDWQAPKDAIGTSIRKR